MARADDQGHAETDEVLEELQKKIKAEYSEATKNAQEKLDDFLEQYKKQDKAQRKRLLKGQITQEEYDGWKQLQIMTGKHWKEMRDTLAEDLSNSDKIARQMIYDSEPEIYAVNHNYGTYQIEHGSQIDTSYTLYDRVTVEKLMTEDKDLLPKPSAKRQREIEASGLKWNRQKVTSATMQSILLGESIPDMAKRIAKATNESNMRTAIRNARTIATGAENRGRQDSYSRAEAMGIAVKKEWIATLDAHTRDSHRQADGQVAEMKDSFSLTGGELEYPGDPAGPPAEVYNCRCTMIPVINDVDPRLNGERISKLGEMTYEEWKEGHQIK